MRKTLIACIATMAMLALTATTASAQMAVQIKSTSTGAPCTAVTAPYTTGGCQVQIDGEIDLGYYFGSTWYPRSDCSGSMKFRIGGQGVVALKSISYGTNGLCGYTGMCGHPSVEFPKSGYIEADQNNALRLVIENFCVQPYQLPAARGTLTANLTRDANRVWTTTNIPRQAIQPEHSIPTTIEGQLTDSFSTVSITTELD